MANDYIAVTDSLLSKLVDALGAEYSIERELGGGGMSRVFVASEHALGRKVVVKVLPPELAAGVNMDRFKREIQLAAQLQHPHVVPLLTSGEKNGLLYFTMPFIEGESLKATLERRGHLSAHETREILKDVVDALAYAHSRGVVHRDIKPANILMSGSHAVVTDFGVAKALSAAIPLPGHTTSGMAIGTPAYMAPEQLAADPAADHRVDIYATGLLAYELLTGTAPFSGSSPQATLAAQLTEKPIDISIRNKSVSAELSKVIMHCLEKDASKRPGTASDLLKSLKELPDSAIQKSNAKSKASIIGGASLVVALLALAAAFGNNGKIGKARPFSADTQNLTAAAETVVVYRDLGITEDRPQSLQLPVVLSQAESLAIAVEMQNRLPSNNPAGRTASAIDPDSLVQHVARLFADSMALALERMEEALALIPEQQQLQRTIMVAPFPPPPDSSRPTPRTERTVGIIPRISPPAPGVQRLAILNLNKRTDNPELDSLGISVLHKVDSAIRTSRGRLEVIPSHATLRLFGDDTPQPTAAGFSLRANWVLSGTWFVRNDSAIVIVALTDVQRGDRTRGFQSAAPLAEYENTIQPAANWVKARLDTLRRSRTENGPG